MAATTTTVVVAFVLPLALTIRNVERTDEINGIVSSAAALGAFIDDGTPTIEVEEAILRYESEFPNIDVTVYREDGEVIGVPVPVTAEVDEALAGQQIVDEQSGGVIAYVPQKGPFDAEGRSSFVIRLAATGDVIDLGVRSIAEVIALSSVISILVGGGMGLLAARMISTPTQNLTAVARRLQHGELDARATPSGPAELRELAETLNHLAARVAELLVRERESVADLAHRLRTPLTALHLEIETLEQTPETDEYGITSFVYRHRWPFHPDRLANELADAWPGVLRSKGFLWLASRPDVQAVWSQAGLSVMLEPLALWYAAMPEDEWELETQDEVAELQSRWDPVVGDRQTEIVFIGVDMDETAIRERLDRCVVTGDEFEKGPEAWARYDDPLPEWDIACDLEG